MPDPADPLLLYEDRQMLSSECGPHTKQDATTCKLLPTIFCAPTTSSGRIFKNLGVLAFSQFLFYQGFVALTNLQSTLNSEQGIGTSSQTAIFATTMVSSLLLAELMIKYLGCKWSFALTVTCSVPYVAANYSPTWATLLPAAVLRGLAEGPLSTAVNTYIDEMARRFARGGDFGPVASLFFGFSVLARSNSEVWGNLISYYALRPTLIPVQNSSSASPSCGIDFERSPNGTGPSSGQSPVPDAQRNVLVTAFFASGVLSVITIAVFLDSLGNDIKREQCRGQFILGRLTAALQQGLKPDQWLLVPISIFCGIQSAFYASEFTQAYIACSWGIYHVGLVTICYGACGTLMCVLVGPLVRITSLMSVIILYGVVAATTCGLLFLWRPSPETPVLYFVFAGLFGAIDVISWSQIPALYGTIFPDNREAAFANYSFWAYFGSFLNYSYANSIGVPLKITIMIAFLVSGLVLCVAGQVKIKCADRRGYVTVEE